MRPNANNSIRQKRLALFSPPSFEAKFTMLADPSPNFAHVDRDALATRLGGELGDAPPGVLQFDPHDEAAWCELIRDVVATANSGGGTLRVSDVAKQIASNAIRDRLAKYAEPIAVHLKHPPLTANLTNSIAEIEVPGAENPISFRRSAPRGATNRLSDQESAFSAGVFYFRHGEQSLPGTSADLKAFFNRKLAGLRRGWMRDIRRVLSNHVTPISAGRNADAENLQPVRIVTDPDAPALQPQDVDRLYPWRQKDLVMELNFRLGKRMLTTYDIQAIRRQHKLDEHPEFVFHLPGAGRRYSPALADWVMSQYAADSEFFAKAHAADQAMLRARRKPR